MGVNMIIGSCIGSHVIGSNVNQIPSQALATLWLDGSIVDVAGSKYFVDKIAGNNVLITGYDFPAGWVSGFPYKSAATIDVFGLTGVSVVSLFQNINYANQQFTRHVAQVLNGSGIETSEPYVTDIVAYSAPLTGADLTAANTYYGVPVEDVSTMAWLSPTGNDTTGDGSKANPYRSLNQIRNSTKVNVYLKSGDYSTSAAAVTFTGATKINLIGTGQVTMTTYAAAVGMTTNRPIDFIGIVFNGNGSTYSINYGYTTGLIRCKITKTDGTTFLLPASSAATLPLSVHSCVLNATVSYGLIQFYRAIATFSFIGNYGNVAIPYYGVNSNGNTIIKYNRGTGATSVIKFRSNAFEYKDNKSLNSLELLSMVTPLVIQNEAINYNLSLTGGQIKNCTITANITGSIIDFSGNTVNGYVNLLAINNTKIYNNQIHSVGQQCALGLYAAINANVTGCEITDNTLTSNHNLWHCLFVGGTTFNETSTNAINGVKILRNNIKNLFIGAGSNHALTVTGGINPVVKYNDITATQGYGIVAKSGSIQNTGSDPHIAYNIIRCTGVVTRVLLSRSCPGLISANNFIICAGATSIFEEDDQVGVSDLLTFNNLITLSGNVAGGLSSGTDTVSRNNVVNKNGFTCTVGANDFETSVVISADGVPASKIEHAEIVAGDNNVGLAVGYAIPAGLAYRNQAAIWQNGAVILP